MAKVFYVLAAFIMLVPAVRFAEAAANTGLGGYAGTYIISADDSFEDGTLVFKVKNKIIIGRKEQRVKPMGGLATEDIRSKKGTDLFLKVDRFIFLFLLRWFNLAGGGKGDRLLYEELKCPVPILQAFGKFVLPGGPRVVVAAANEYGRDEARPSNGYRFSK